MIVYVVICVVLVLVTSLLTYLLDLGTSDTPPVIYSKDCPLKRHLLASCWRLSQPFHPATWLRNAHVQTILASLAPPAEVTYRREMLRLADGGQLALDWAEKDGWRPQQTCPVILSLPTLTGDRVSMSQFCKSAQSRGYRVLVVNKRGYGGSQLTSPWLSSFGDPRDLRETVEHVRRLYPQAPLCGVGHSAGSGLLVSYLGEYGAGCGLTVAVGVSPGYDLEYLFKQCIRQPYHTILLRNLKRMLTSHRLVMSGVLDIDHVMKARSLPEFEEHCYCKLYKHKSMADYWQQNNPVRDIDNITVPTLCISSLDDPVCRKDCIQQHLFQKRPGFMLVTTEHGGHCGFLGRGWTDRWADQLALDYITSVLDYTAELLQKGES